MKNPHKVQVLLPHEIEALEKEKQKSKLERMQEDLARQEREKDEPKPTKWYMGEYANNDGKILLMIGVLVCYASQTFKTLKRQ